MLGDKIDQKGSLVNEDRLRFDFSYNKPIEVEELKRVEEIVPNRKFRKYANSESPTSILLNDLLLLKTNTQIESDGEYPSTFRLDRCLSRTPQ